MSTRDVALGLAAGALGVWAMDRLDWALWDRQPEAVRRRIEDVRPGGLDPAHVLAHRTASALGKHLTPAQPHPAGVAVHYAVGALPAVVYALLRRRVPAVAAGGGLLYGLGAFLLEDELAGPALGLAAPPQSYPWQAHARGLLSHLLYGAVTEAALRLLTGPAGRR